MEVHFKTCKNSRWRQEQNKGPMWLGWWKGVCLDVVGDVVIILNKNCVKCPIITFREKKHRYCFVSDCEVTAF